MIDDILQEMQQKNIEAIFVLKSENIAYLTGFKPSSASILILKDEPLFLTSKLDMEEATEKSRIHVEEFQSLDKVKNKFKKTLQGKIGVENTMNVGTYKKLCKEFQIEITDIIERFRAIKSKNEIQKIKGAINIAENSLKDSLKNISFSETENQLAAELEYNLKTAGSLKPPFDTIVASGPRSSLPHATTSGKKLESPVMIDWGAFYQNYVSDITRTIINSEEEEEILSIILEAQKKAIKTIKPGIKASYVDKVARNIIDDYGYGEYFIHSTGHGLGLEVHETPSLSPRSDEKLEKGMVVTVEPGIYIEGKFGVRIEDMVHVENRAKVLTNYPQKITE